MNSTNLFAAASFDVTPFLTTVLVVDAKKETVALTLLTIGLVSSYLFAFNVVKYLDGRYSKIGLSLIKAAGFALFILSYLYAERTIIQLKDKEDKEDKEDSEVAGTGTQEH